MDEIEFEAEARRLRDEAEREESDPAYLARRAAKRAADVERNARATEQHAAWKAELQAQGEWIEDEPEDEA